MHERNVRILKSINAVRTRPGQYIGDTSTCDHIIQECIDNMLDELRNGYGNSAGISFSKNGEVLVFDSGRGLPYGTSIDEETNKPCDSIESLFTKLHSGTKFSMADDQLESLFGQNGVGLVAVNALSEFVDIRTKSEKTGAYHYRFEDSELVSHEKIKDSVWSTEIVFKPSAKYFDSVIPHYSLFLDRLKLAQSKIPGSQFVFNGKVIPEMAMDDFVRERLHISKDTPLFMCEHKTKKITIKEPTTGKVFELPGNITVYLTYEIGETIIDGDVNLRFCEGSYLTNLQASIKSILPSKINKKFQKTPDRFLIEGLRLYASMQVPFPRFDSQTKTRIVLDVKNDLIAPLDSKLGKILSEKHIVSVVETILNQKLGSACNISKAKKISSDNKLHDCVQRPGDVLYIVEGDSAEAAIRDARYPRSEASLPLRGKILNVEKQTLARIKDNKEIKNIIEAVGIGPNYRYKKVKIICDADCDGLHIIVLIVLIFCKYFKELILDGRLSIILPPLYGAIKKDTFVPIYDPSEISSYKNKGYDIQRFKGLGEMSGKFMRQILNKEVEHVVQYPKNEKTVDKLINIITSSEEKRKYLSFKKEFNFDDFINNVFLKLKKEGVL